MAKRSKYLPPKNAQLQYERQLRRVAKHSADLVNAHIEGDKLIDEAGMLRATTLYSQAIEPWAVVVASQMFRAVDKKNADAYAEFSKRVGAGLKVDLHGDKGLLAKSIVGEQVGLIKSIPTEAAARAQKYAYQAAINGERSTYVAEQLSKTTEVTQSRATLIARTEIAKANAAINQSRSQSLGLNEYVWRTAEDDRVRESHAELDGTTQSWDNPPQVGDEGSFNPGEIYNCVLGDSQLDATSAINIFYRRRYSGKLATLVLDNGVVLSATLNHPILTDNGFFAIDSINVGDNVVCTTEQAFNNVKNDVHGFNITFEKLFNTVNNLNGFVRSTSVNGQFHGDVSNEEVDIIRPNGGLILERYAHVVEKLTKLNFTETDNAFCHLILSSTSSLNKLGVTTLSSFASDVRRVDLIKTLLRRHFSPFDLFCFALGSSFDSSDFKMSLDNATVDVKGFSNLVFAYSLLIHGFDLLDVKINNVMATRNDFINQNPQSFQMLAKDVWVDANLRGSILKEHTSLYKANRVVDKRVRDFSGHVYNLETTTGLYHTEGVIKSNCRCYAEPIVSVADS